jgi:hypothetical protein
MTFNSRIRLSVLFAASALLAGCALIDSIQTGKPIDPNQVKQDAAVAKDVLQTTGCVAEVGAEVAAPIVDANGDQAAQTDVKAAGKAGTVLCSGGAGLAPAAPQ